MRWWTLEPVDVAATVRINTLSGITLLSNSKGFTQILPVQRLETSIRWKVSVLLTPRALALTSKRVIKAGLTTSIRLNYCGTPQPWIFVPMIHVRRNGAGLPRFPLLKQRYGRNRTRIFTAGLSKRHPNLLEYPPSLWMSLLKLNTRELRYQTSQWWILTTPSW